MEKGRQTTLEQTHFNNNKLVGLVLLHNMLHNDLS